MCVVYRWVRMLMAVCAVFWSGWGRQRAAHVGWCQRGTHSTQHTNHTLQLYTKALTHKDTHDSNTHAHTHDTDFAKRQMTCFYPKCLTVCTLLTQNADYPHTNGRKLPRRVKVVKPSARITTRASWCSVRGAMGTRTEARLDIF